MSDREKTGERSGTTPPPEGLLGGPDPAGGGNRDDLESRRYEQNLPAAVLAGGVASLLGAGIWAAVTATTHSQIGWMAVGVGFLVGLAVRKAGRGLEPRFGAVGAGFSLIGCLLGNVLTIYVVEALNDGAPFLDVLRSMSLDDLMTRVKTSFEPIDLLFYGIAVYEGYRFSFDAAAAALLEKSSGKSAGKS